MRTHCAAKAFVAFLCLLCSVVSARDPDQQVPALKPEVQTAAWAQAWWMPRQKEKLEGLKKQEKIDLIMIGDSITHGRETAVARSGTSSTRNAMRSTLASAEIAPRTFFGDCSTVRSMAFRPNWRSS